MNCNLCVIVYVNTKSRSLNVVYPRLRYIDGKIVLGLDKTNVNVEYESGECLFYDEHRCVCKHNSKFITYDRRVNITSYR